MCQNNGISQYRAELMAMSMFAILLTHFKVSLGIYALDRVALLCQGGVDVFLFLSGFGLYYSGMKSYRSLKFYVKRFKRIFPPFVIILLLTLWQTGKLHWPDFLWGASTLAFWFQSTNKYSFGWFVSLIVVLYFIFPWYFRYFRKSPRLASSAGVCLGLLLTGWYVYRYQIVYPGGQGRFILPAARIPIFFVGVYCAYWLQSVRFIDTVKKRRLKIYFVLLSIITLLLLNLALNIWGFKTMRNTGMLYLPYILIIPGFLIALVWWFRKMERIRWGRRIMFVLKQLGSCTLEAYLLIAIMYSYIPILSKHLAVSPLTSNILLFFTTIVAAWLIHKMVVIVVDYCEEKCLTKSY